MLHHKYVFDEDKRKFIGKFEEMYSDEDNNGYDSWNQDDLTHLSKRISLSILGDLNFSKVLDLGCGKGTFTHMLKKDNNEVVGVDISKTAIKKAISKYPDIKFISSSIEEFLGSNKETYDLVVIGEVLSYLEKWADILEKVAGITDYIYMTLYIPDNPIGYVKSFADLEKKFEEYFEEKTVLLDKLRSCMFLFGKRK